MLVQLAQMESPRACDGRALCVALVYTENGEVQSALKDLSYNNDAAELVCAGSLEAQVLLNTVCDP